MVLAVLFLPPNEGEAVLKKKKQEIEALESAILFHCASLHFLAHVQSLPVMSSLMTVENIYAYCGRNSATEQALKNLCSVQLECDDPGGKLQLNKASLSRMHRLLEHMSLPSAVEADT